MAYDPGLVERVADALPSLGASSARQKGMFGGRGFMVGKHTFVIVFDEDLIVKTPPSEYERALTEPGTSPFAPGGDRPMSTWIVVRGDAIADDPELAAWLARGLRAVR
jgi:TfoX/Sxy family transcriptional regulator of competence genes